MLIVACMIFRAELAAGIVLVLSVIANTFIAMGNPLIWITQNLDKTLEVIAAYLLIGVIWGIIHWFIYLNSKETKDTILEAHKNWQNYVNDGTPFKKSTYYPFSWNNDSSMITAWVLLWPFSILWTFFSELLTNTWNSIWRFAKWVGISFGNLYGKMAENTVDNVINKNVKKD
jgi:hypothetical protein